MTPLTTCQRCDAVITGDFARVFGNNEHEAYACPHCATAGAITSGAAVSEAATGGRAVWVYDDETWSLKHRDPREREDGPDEQAPVYLADLAPESGAVATDAGQSEIHEDAAFVALLD